jgi:hypothetical protein
VSSGCRNLQKGGKKQFFLKNSTTDLKIEKRKEKRGSCNRSLLQSWTVLEEEEIGEKLLNLY